MEQSRVWQECPILESHDRILVKNIEASQMKAYIVGEYADGSMYRRVYDIPFPDVEITISLHRGGLNPEKYYFIYGEELNSLFYQAYSSEFPSTLILYMGKIATFHNTGIDVSEFVEFESEASENGESSEDESESDSTEESEEENNDEDSAVVRYRRDMRRHRKNMRPEE